MRHKSEFEKRFTRQKKVFNKAERQMRDPNYEPQHASEQDELLFDMQKQKLELLQELRQEREMITNGERLQGRGSINRHVAYAEAEDGQGYFLVKDGDEVVRASFGDLLTDITYGIEHNIDTSKMPTAIARTYILEKSKTKIRELFDIQLLINEAKKVGYHNKQFAQFLDMMKELRVRDLEKDDSGDTVEKDPGLLFEQQIISLLKQIQYDLPDMNIELIEADVLEDIHTKVDFIVKVKKHNRGVHVGKEAQDIAVTQQVLGIQFTLTRDPKKIVRKEKQISATKERGIGELDDLLLITVPVSRNEVRENYRNWKKLGKPTGGPSRLYDHNTKLEILRQLLQGIGETDLVEENKSALLEYYDSKLAGVDQAAVSHGLFEEKV